MNKSIGALLLLLIVPTAGLADGRGHGSATVSGAVVVGGAYGPRGGYYGPRGGYYGPGWRSYGPGVGVYYGAPLGWGWPWGPPVYYPPPVVYPPVIAVPPPVVYVEKGAAGDAAVPGSGESLEPGYWYFCRQNGGYYPAVMQCPGPWEKVAPVND
ncbi:MAG: hypothetical protein JNK99_12910 [Candidatus Accumulibacter sp.]|jgi:hypothetical protein|uniref:hypothetical protein n=1 Tax=Accumulibacter sp. TaxID=2053492 RepID=UPI001A4D6370|nr:hypothetical protein [Accumulibacter sp.]MBL8395623.1 hypothetical protein [Accumulibacter sp.]